MIKNKYITCYGVTTIFLRRKKGNMLPCYLDEVDFMKYIVNKTLTWRARYAETSKTFYACTNIPLANPPALLHLHRVIMGLPIKYDYNQTVDHLDYNGLNNKRNNLEVKTLTLNIRNQRLQTNNTSGYKGVSWDKSRGNWIVQIRRNNKSSSKRYYSEASAIAAAKALHED